MKVLVIDIGGSNVKALATGQDEPRKFPSSREMTPGEMVSGIIKLAEGWEYDVIAIGYPGIVCRDRVMSEPHNLGTGWVGFDFATAFGCPVKIINDAAMQALGSYEGNKMLFLGLGTGLGSAMIADGTIVPMELGHLPYKKRTYEDYVGDKSLEKKGKKKWRKHVVKVVAHLTAALQPSYVVLGGGNVSEFKELPPGCRAGDNSKAFTGGFRLWEDRNPRHPAALPEPREDVADIPPSDIAFLFDLDNTLLDNDRVIVDLQVHLERQVGAERAAHYWELFEELRGELGYADYLGALQRYRGEYPYDADIVTISRFLLNYPFEDRLFPRVPEVVEHVRQWGPAALLTDGDVVFQPWKANRSGLSEAVDGKVLIYLHKEKELADVERRCPAKHYVVVEDKLRLLAAIKKIWGARVTTVFVRQGHYASDPEILAEQPAADISIERIGDLLQYDLARITAPETANP